MSRPARRVLLVAESLMPGNGGICRVARMMGRALAERPPKETLIDALVLSDAEAPRDIALPARACNGSRPRFVAGLHTGAVGHTHYIYDYVGLARAHPRVWPFKRPFLSFIHGIEVWEGTHPARVSAAHRARMLLSNSAYTRDRAERTFGGFGRARVCWLATEEDETPRAVGNKDGPPTAVIVARLDMDGYKGHRELIGCWGAVRQAVPEARLVVVGRGPGLEQLQALVARSEAAKGVEFRGFVPDERMQGVWDEAHVLAMPSRGEGFGLVYIEAMRQGVPVIASMHDAAPEVNLDGLTGFNVDLNRPGELTGRMVELLRDRAVAEEMGRAGRERWRAHFRYSAFRERFLGTMEEFLNM